MFGLFKKEPPEVKHGRAVYLKNEDKFIPDNKNWILALSAVYMEFKDIETAKKCVYHDLIGGYEEGFSKLDLVIINADTKLKSLDDLENRMKDLSRCWPEDVEMGLYNVLSMETDEEVDDFIDEYCDDDYYQESVLEEAWKNKTHYQEGFHYRVGLIIETMWEIRVLVTKKLLTPPEAWKQLYILADLLRPIITMFSSWEEFLENQRLFLQLETPGKGTMRDFEAAIACLLNLSQSPLHKIPYDYGIDKNYPYNLTENTYKKAKKIGYLELPEPASLIKLLKEEDKQPLWDALNALSKEKSYQYVPLITEYCNTKNFEEEDAIEIPELYPDEPYAWLLRGNYYSSLAWDARGEGTADTVGEENYRLFHERLAYAFNDYYKAYQLSPNDPSIWADLESVMLLTYIENNPIEREEIRQKIAEHGLDHSYAVRIMASGMEERWGGSYEQGIAWKNHVISNTERGVPSRLIPFITTMERYDYIRCFEDDDDQAEAMFRDPELVKELDLYFDELLENLHKDPHRIASYLSFWYQETGDLEKLRAVGRTMIPGCYMKGPWRCYSDSQIDCVMNWIRSI